MSLPEIKGEVTADLSKIAEDAYTDAFKDTLRELSKVGVDVVKTVRLFIFPLQFSAAWQDSLAKWIDRSIKKVPEADRISPPPSSVLQILDGLKYRFDGDLIGEMYSNLLSRVFDAKRLGEAHPSFISILSQISPDEAKLVSNLADSNGKLYFSKDSAEWSLSFESIIDKLVVLGGERVRLDLFYKDALNPREYGQPIYLSMYIEHLASLGVVTWVNDDPLELFGAIGKRSYIDEVWQIKLTPFGKLFYKACVQDVSGLSATTEDRI